MTPLMVSLLASGTNISIKALPMLVSIVETVILPVALGFLLNYLLGKKKMFSELQKIMPGVAVLGLACVVEAVQYLPGTESSQSGAVIFVAVFSHNGLGYLLGYGAGKLVGMNTAKKRTIAIVYYQMIPGICSTAFFKFFEKISNFLFCPEKPAIRRAFREILHHLDSRQEIAVSSAKKSEGYRKSETLNTSLQNSPVRTGKLNIVGHVKKYTVSIRGRPPPVVSASPSFFSFTYVCPPALRDAPTVRTAKRR